MCDALRSLHETHESGTSLSSHEYRLGHKTRVVHCVVMSRDVHCDVMSRDGFVTTKDIVIKLYLAR